MKRRLSPSILGSDKLRSDIKPLGDLSAHADDRVHNGPNNRIGGRPLASAQRSWAFSGRRGGRSGLLLPMSRSRPSPALHLLPLRNLLGPCLADTRGGWHYHASQVTPTWQFPPGAPEHHADLSTEDFGFGDFWTLTLPLSLLVSVIGLHILLVVWPL